MGVAHEVKRGFASLNVGAWGSAPYRMITGIHIKNCSGIQLNSSLGKGVILLCGRYTVFTEEEMIEMNAIIAEVSRKFGPDAVHTGEIFPTNTAPILMSEGGQLVPVPASWGFPKWGGGKGVVINARSESALHKSMFSKALLTRRCVIPSTGFFDWTFGKAAEPENMSLFGDAEKSSPGKGKKVKLHFRLPGESMLYMAGIHDTSPDAQGKPRHSFCILTTEASHSLAHFHERMPVILFPGEIDDWIRDEAFMREVLTRKGPELEWRRAS